MSDDDCDVDSSVGDDDRDAMIASGDGQTVWWNESINNMVRNRASRTPTDNNGHIDDDALLPLVSSMEFVTTSTIVSIPSHSWNSLAPAVVCGRHGNRCSTCEPLLPIRSKWDHAPAVASSITIYAMCHTSDFLSIDKDGYANTYMAVSYNRR